MDAHGFRANTVVLHALEVRPAASVRGAASAAQEILTKG
jgi:hypothetical protein